MADLKNPDKMVALPIKYTVNGQEVTAEEYRLAQIGRKMFRDGKSHAEVAAAIGNLADRL